jgi:hypothetical protein
MEVWGFLWIMLALKIPLAALLAIVWWAVRSTPEPEADAGSSDDDDGGIRRPHDRPPRPRDPRRRGPHGDPVVPPPPRSRTVVRSCERQPR